MNDIASFTFIRNYHDSLKGLDKESKKELLNAIDDFMFEDIEPTFDGINNSIWVLIRPQLLISKNKSNRNQIETKSKPSRMKDYIYINIINYLNKVLDSNYKYNTKSTLNRITTRLEEGHKEEDFYKVIDKKYKEWKGTDFDKFLRPETLFGTKFESYLNQKEKETTEEKIDRLRKEEANEEK